MKKIYSTQDKRIIAVTREADKKAKNAVRSNRGDMKDINFITDDISKCDKAFNRR